MDTEKAIKVFQLTKHNLYKNIFTTRKNIDNLNKVYKRRSLTLGLLYYKRNGIFILNKWQVKFSLKKYMEYTFKETKQLLL